MYLQKHSFNILFLPNLNLVSPRNKFYKLAYMMKLVDMRGLKPRPFRGPGSTPGIGILSYKLVYMTKYLYLESNQDP